MRLPISWQHYIFTGVVCSNTRHLSLILSNFLYFLSRSRNKIAMKVLFSFVKKLGLDVFFGDFVVSNSFFFQLKSNSLFISHLTNFNVLFYLSHLFLNIVE